MCLLFKYTDEIWLRQMREQPLGATDWMKKGKKIISVIPRWLITVVKLHNNSFYLRAYDVECRETRNIINKCDLCDTENSVWAKCHINLKKGLFWVVQRVVERLRWGFLLLSWMTKVFYFSLRNFSGCSTPKSMFLIYF